MAKKRVTKRKYNPKTSKYEDVVVWVDASPTESSDSSSTASE